MNKEKIAIGFAGLQEHICKSLGDLDQNAAFNSDYWQRAEGGGG